MAPQVSRVVVDNASSDRTVDMVRACGGAKLIANKKNLGFAYAVNQGVREAAGSDFILVLNPDTELLRRPLGGCERQYSGRFHDPSFSYPKLARLRTIWDQPAVALQPFKPGVPVPGPRFA